MLGPRHQETRWQSSDHLRDRRRDASADYFSRHAYRILPAHSQIVEVPGRRWRASDAGQASFVAVWLSIVGAWTAGAMAASPFFALFSTPFWLAGVRMAKDLVPSSTIVSIGKYAWEIATNTPLKSSPKVVSGATVDLDEAKLAIDAYVNDSPVTSLRLVEGVNEHVVRGLAPVEQQFLADLINAWLDHLAKRPLSSRAREPIPEASMINIEASRIGD